MIEVTAILEKDFNVTATIKGTNHTAGVKGAETYTIEKVGAVKSGTITHSFNTENIIAYCIDNDTGNAVTIQKIQVTSPTTIDWVIGGSGDKTINLNITFLEA